MAYFALIFSALAGALFGQTYKWKSELGLDTARVLAWFALSAAVLLGIIVTLIGPVPIVPQARWMPFAHGLAMAIAMHTYYRVIEQHRLGISWTAVQLSVVIPFAASVAGYEETLDLTAVLGAVSVLVAIVLFGLGRERRASRERKAEGVGSVALLVVASVFTGITSALLRSFAFYHPEPQAVPSFFLFVSLTLLVLNAPLYIYRCKRYSLPLADPKTTLFSAYKSVTNMSAMGLMLASVQLLPGFFVFPVRNTLNILFVLVLSKLIHKERISSVEATGLLFALAGIGLLSYAMA